MITQELLIVYCQFSNLQAGHEAKAAHKSSTKDSVKMEIRLLEQLLYNEYT